MEFPSRHDYHDRHHRDVDEREEFPPPPFDQPPSRFHGPPPPFDQPQSEFRGPPPPFDQPPSGFHGPPPPFDQPPSEFRGPPPPFDQPPSRFHGPPPPFDQPPSEFRGPPPPFGQPPPPHPHSYYGRDDFGPPPTYTSRDFDEPPPPSTTPAIQTLNKQEGTETHHSHRPHLPSFLQTHQSSDSLSELKNKPTFRVYCKAGPNYALTVSDRKLFLSRSNPTDETQRWYKDEKYSTSVKDQEGFPCFALINKATGLAMKHSIGVNHPVQLITYNPDGLDESILWTMSKDLGDGYRTIRMVNNIRLNMDAYHGDKKSGGVHDGTTVVLSEWHKGDNQRWIVTPN